MTQEDMTQEDIKAARDTIRTALNIYGMEVDTFSAAKALLYFNALCESAKATAIGYCNDY